MVPERAPDVAARLCLRSATTSLALSLACRLEADLGTGGLHPGSSELAPQGHSEWAET